MEKLYALFDQYPGIPIGIIGVLFVVGLLRRTGKTKAVIQKATRGILDEPLLWFTRDDAYKVRDLLNGGAVILGRPGSGKTTSSGNCLMRAIVGVKGCRSGGVILAAKPEDEEDVKRVFEKAKRLQDLIIFDLDEGNRSN
jgi:hypothetical protein